MEPHRLSTEDHNVELGSIILLSRSKSLVLSFICIYKTIGQLFLAKAKYCELSCRNTSLTGFYFVIFVYIFVVNFRRCFGNT